MSSRPRGKWCSRLKARLYLLALLPLIPVYALTIYSAFEQKTETEQLVLWKVQSLARRAADRESHLLQDVHSELLKTAELFSIHKGALPQIGSFLAAILHHSPGFSNLGIADPDGGLHFSVVPIEGPANFAERTWFARAVASRGFSMGNFHLDRISGKPVVVAAEPVFDSSGQLLAVVFAALDTRWLNAAIFGNDMEIPAGATLHQVDAEGRVLTYDPGTGLWTNQEAFDTGVLASLRRADSGVARGRDARQAACIYGFARLKSPLKQRSLYITLEQPQQTAFAESNRRLIRNLILLGLVTVLAFAAVWFVSERLVLKRVSRIVRTTRKLAGGDLGARVGPMAGKDEIFELAGAFDEMAVALEKRMDEEKQAKEALSRSKEELRQLAAYLQQVREDERTRIAREIHDDFGQSLTILKMDLSWLQHHLPSGASDLHDKIDAASGVIDSALETLHRVSSELRPVILDDFGIVAAIEWQLEEFKQRTGMACELERTVDEIDLNREQATAVFRIFQEALTNVMRHSGADRLNVRLAVHDDTLHLELKDNGRGIRKAEMQAPDAFGLIGMRERLRPWNGSIRFTGNPAKGTCVQVRLPLGKQGG